MAANTKRCTWLSAILCLYFNLTVVSAEEDTGLAEGTIIALACLFGALFIGLVLGTTCCLIRRYRTRQFLKQKKEFEILEGINKEFSESLHSEEIFPATKMTLLQNGQIPVHGEVQKYTDWARRQPQPSPLVYAKRMHDVRPTGRQVTQRVFTVPTTTKTVFTQKPKIVIHQNRAKSAPPPLVRTNYYTRDRYGFTNAHFLPMRGYPPTTYVDYGPSHVTKRYIASPQWRQEVVRQEVVRQAPPPAPVPAPVQYIETAAPLIATGSTQMTQTTHRSSGEDVYHIKLNTNTMDYSKEKLGGSGYNLRESSSYSERTYTDPGDQYVINTKLSSYKPKVLQGTYYGESGHGWRIAGDSGTGMTDTYRFSGSWAGQENEVKTQTATFDDNENDDGGDVFIRQESQDSSAFQAVQKRTYEEVVIVDYVDNVGTNKDTPLTTSTPRFPTQEVATLDDVLNNESSGSSSDSESDSGMRRHKKKQRNPSSGSS